MSTLFDVVTLKLDVAHSEDDRAALSKMTLDFVSYCEPHLRNVCNFST